MKPGWFHRGWRRMVTMATVVSLLVSGSLWPVPTASALSIGEEKELGAKLLETIKEHMPLVEDPEILTYVRSVGNRIVQQLGTTPYEFQFFVVNESVPNAFAIPGGYVFLYRGLVELMTTEGELASVISHELAHIQARHIHRRLQEGRILNIAALAGVLAGIFLGMGSDASQAVAMGSMAGARSFELKYSRENEEEADQYGLKYLCAAGYPAKDMVGAMQQLSRGNWGGGSRVPSYLSTHPALTERVLYLQDLVQKQQAAAPQGGPPPGSRDFAIVQAALVAEYGNPQVAVDRLQVEAKRGGAAPVYGLGRFYFRQGNMSEAMRYLQDAARLEAGSPIVLSTLGAAYIQQGKLIEARKVLQSALLLDTSAPVVHLRMAQVLQDLGQKDEALEHLQCIETLAPMFPEIDYQLGVLLGQLNRLGVAHYHLGRYYLAQRDHKLAIFHYKKAKAMIQGSPQKMEEIDRTLEQLEKKKKEAFWESQREGQRRR